MKDPAFLFYSGDFLTGVVDLTMEERGQFITLLCLQHQKGSLSEKTIRLSVGSVSVDVLKKFRLMDDGYYLNERLSLEIEKRANFTESRRENGKKGGRPKKNIPGDIEKKPNGYPNGYPTDNLMGNVNDNENIIREKGGAGGKRFEKPTIAELVIEATRIVELKSISLSQGQINDIADKFYHHYESNGWMVGKNKMKSWRAALAGQWLSKENKFNNHSNVDDDKSSNPYFKFARQNGYQPPGT